ncbi:MAG: hypothetical protein ACFFFG_13250 [Candidatus Thorarchaeota archaeon]
MILIQTYQELFYALKVLQLLKEKEDPTFQKLVLQIENQVEKLG